MSLLSRRVLRLEDPHGVGITALGLAEALEAMRGRNGGRYPSAQRETHEAAMAEWQRRENVGEEVPTLIRRLLAGRRRIADGAGGGMAA